MNTDRFLDWLKEQHASGNLGDVAISYQLMDGTCGYHTDGSNYTNLALVTTLQHGIASRLAQLRDTAKAH